MFNTITKILKFCKYYEKDFIFAAVIIMISVISFGLGRLSKIREDRVPLTIENLNYDQTSSAINSQKIFVASKSGKKYHYVWCDSANSIKEENKIFFSAKEEAVAAGYEPASNCKGL